jgi:hypothetical protein
MNGQITNAAGRGPAVRRCGMFGPLLVVLEAVRGMRTRSSLTPISPGYPQTGTKEGGSMRGFLFTLAVVVLAALALFASTAAAGPPAIATGTWLITGAPTVTDIRTAGDNTFITESFPFTHAGDVNGSAVASGTLRLASDGSAGFNGTTVCSGCTIGGRTGDFTTTINAQGSNDGQAKGVITVLSATGGLAGLHGVDHFEGNFVTGTGTYTYTFSFEP